jgi:hypothetical protein
MAEEASCSIEVTLREIEKKGPKLRVGLRISAWSRLVREEGIGYMESSRFMLRRFGTILGLGQ